MLSSKLHWITELHSCVQGMQSWTNICAHGSSPRSTRQKKTRIELQNSLGLGKKYHHPLRKSYYKFLKEYQIAEPSLALSISVKTLNDTLVPEGNVSPVFVSGAFPLPYFKSEQKWQRLISDKRAVAAILARREMSTIMAQMRLNEELKHEISRAAYYIYKDEDKVLIR